MKQTRLYNIIYHHLIPKVTLRGFILHCSTIYLLMDFLFLLPSRGNEYLGAESLSPRVPEQARPPGPSFPLPRTHRDPKRLTLHFHPGRWDRTHVKCLAGVTECNYKTQAQGKEGGFPKSPLLASKATKMTHLSTLLLR